MEWLNVILAFDLLSFELGKTERPRWHSQWCDTESLLVGALNLNAQQCQRGDGANEKMRGRKWMESERRRERRRLVRVSWKKSPDSVLKSKRRFKNKVGGATRFRYLKKKTDSEMCFSTKLKSPFLGET